MAVSYSEFIEKFREFAKTDVKTVNDALDYGVSMSGGTECGALYEHHVYAVAAKRLSQAIYGNAGLRKTGPQVPQYSDIIDDIEIVVGASYRLWA